MLHPSDGATSDFRRVERLAAIERSAPVSNSSWFTAVNHLGAQTLAYTHKGLYCTFMGVRLVVVIHYLSLIEVANRLGLSFNTVKGYLRKGMLPPHDAEVGRNRGWLPETIDDLERTRAESPAVYRGKPQGE